MPERSF
jgi:hypothetical protein